MSGSQDGSKAAFPGGFAGPLRADNSESDPPIARTQDLRREAAGLVAAPASGSRIEALENQILACRICRDRPRGSALVHEPRPVFRFSGSARLLIASQAPGMRAHLSGIPFHDPSGQRLRHWMGLDESTFYDATRIAIVPMGFCFPGHDSQKGDLPPRPECRTTWHDRVFVALPQVETILAIGLFAIRYHVARLMPDRKQARGLSETVADWRDYFERPAPRILPLPHPSWRNNGWIKRNPWFEAELLPVLRSEVDRVARVNGGR